MANRRVRTIVVWTALALVTVIGLITTVVGLITPVSFGWFAYQPLADAAFTPAQNVFVLSRPTAVGLGVLAVGLIGLSFLAGRRSGLRRDARDTY